MGQARQIIEALQRTLHEGGAGGQTKLPAEQTRANTRLQEKAMELRAALDEAGLTAEVKREEIAEEGRQADNALEMEASRFLAEAGNQVGL